MKNIAFFLGIVLILTGSVIALLLISEQLQTTDRTQLFLEIAKGIIELCLIVTIGGAIKWGYDNIAQDRKDYEIEKNNVLQRQSEINILRKDLIRTFHENWLDFMKSLREEEIRTSEAYSRYDSTINELNDLRGKLESFIFDLETAPGLFKKQDAIKQHLQSTIAIIDIILKEYDGKNATYGLTKDELYKKHPKYVDFCKHLNNYEIEHKVAVSLMREDIFSPKAKRV